MPHPRALVAACLVAAACSNEQVFFSQSDVDTFVQVPNDSVDILFVVDESYSMAEEQELLAQGFQSFLIELEAASADFHIGLVSTSADSDDPDRGKLIGEPTFLTPTDDYVALFQERVRLGVNGSDKEKGLEAAALALSPELLVAHNTGFVREEANLLVVVVSDEDDCSDAGVLDGQESAACYRQRDSLTPVRDLLLEIHDAKGGQGEMVQLGAIVDPLRGMCEDTWVGQRYVDAVALTGGVLGPICDPDWAYVLQRLGLNALGIRDTFTLEFPADAATIEVTVDERPVLMSETSGWTYNWVYQTITFHGPAVPPRGATVVVTYDLAPDPGI